MIGLNNSTKINNNRLYCKTDSNNMSSPFCEVEGFLITYSRFKAFKHFTSSGTSVLCPAANVLAPTACTSASTASCATSIGI